MTSDFSLVVQTAKRNSHVFTAHRLCNAFAETGFTNSWRTIEAEDRALQVITQSSYSEVFQNALFHLFHAIMVFVQNLFGMFETQVIYGAVIPRQIYHCLQVVDLCGIVRTLRMQGVESLEFLIEYFLYILIPIFALGFLKNLFLLWAHIVSAELFLDVLELLLQEVFTLLFVQIILCFLADVRLYVK